MAKKWYKKYFLQLVNISTFNAHIIAKSNGYRKSTIQFLEELVEPIFVNFVVIKNLREKVDLLD